MNSRKKSIYLRIVCLLLIFGFCYYKAYLSYSELQRNFDCISIRLQDQAVTKKQVMKALETMQEQPDSHIPELAAYHMTEHVQITEPGLGRNTHVTLYGVFGQMRLVTPSEVTCGNFPVFDDYYGCVIDEDSAYDIFGSTKVMGQIIKVDQTEYHIRGVIRSEMPIMMIQEKAEDTQFWNLELSYGKLQMGRTYAEQLMSNFIPGSYILIEQNFIADCIGNILVLPSIVLGILLIFLQNRKIHRSYVAQYEEMHHRNYRTKKDWFHFCLRVLKQSFLPIIIIAGSIGLFLVTWHFFGVYPMRYFPTKWSKFEVYSQFYNEIKKHLSELSYVNPTRFEVLLKQKCTNCIFFGAASLLLEWHILDLIHLVRGKQLRNTNGEQ